MKYIITGGAGFIGSNIVEELVKRGEEVVVIDDLSTGREENLEPFKEKILFIKGSITDLNLLKEKFQGADYVLHLAAMASVPQSVDDPEAANKINIDGTLNVLLAAKHNGVKRVVYSGSCAAYGDSPEMPKKETMLPNPLSPYALTKLSAEYYCQVFTKIYGVETVVLRYFNVFGPRQNPDSEYSAVIPIFITKLINDEPPTIFGDGMASRDFVFVKNVVDANLLACTAEDVSGNVFNIGCGKDISLLELTASINKYLGKDLKPIHKEERKGDVKLSLADISKARQFLRYELKIDFDEGLKQTIEWYKTNS